MKPLPRITVAAILLSRNAARRRPIVISEMGSRSAIRSRTAIAVAAALVMAFTASTHATAAGLSIAGLSPTAGSVGTLVTISGSGFSNGDLVAFNGTDATQVTANSTGTELRARVPAFATSGVVGVTDPASGQMVSLPNSPFRVTRGVFASSKQVWAGGRLLFAGSDLKPDHSYPVFIRSRVRRRHGHGYRIHVQRVGTAITDRNGDFQIGVSVPWDEQAGRLSLYLLHSARALTTVLFILGAWPEFHHDVGLTGAQTYETVLTPSTVSKLGLKWFFPTSDVVDSSPVVADGMVYVGSQDGNLYAIDAATGKGAWSFPTGGPVTSAPAVANGRVFVYSAGGIIYALDSASGKELWQRSAGADSNSSPVAADGMVYVGSHYDGSIYAFNQATGSLKWNFPTGYPLDSPAVVNNIVYFGSEDGHVYAVNAHTGLKLWSRHTGKIDDSSPAIANGLLYIGTDAGVLYSLNSSTGAVKWSWADSGYEQAYGPAIHNTPAVSNGMVFFGTDYGCLHALNASTGKLVWTQLCALGSSIRSSPAVANGVLYVVGGLYQHLLALNPTTGATLADALSWDTPVSSPAVSNGMIYIGSDHHDVLAFGI
jgi:outer membrane protein assembly factor BamB